MLTNEQYEVVIAMLTEKVQAQEHELGFFKWRNSDLEKKLAEAEAQIKEKEKA